MWSEKAFLSNPCNICEKTKEVAVEGDTLTMAKYSHDNHMSIVRPISCRPEYLQRFELFSLMGELSVLEAAVLKPVKPLICMSRLKGGMLAYSGHTIALENNANQLISAVPRKLNDCGVVVFVDSVIHRTFADVEPLFKILRCRRNLMKRSLKLLVDHHKYMSAIFPNGAGIELDDLDNFPEDGVPAGVEVFYEDRFTTITILQI